MAYRGLDLGAEPEESTSRLLRSVRQQEAQFQQLSRELREERANVADQLEKCKYAGSETASVSSLGSSTDESFVWRGHGPDSIADDDDFLTDEESHMSGSELVDSCLKVLQERGISNPRDGRDPLHHRRMDSPSGVSGHSNRLMSPDWERDLMDADVTPGGSQGVKKVVTRTEVRTVRTVNGKVIQDDLETRQYGHDRSLTNGERHPSRGYASADEYGPARQYGSRGGYSSGEDGRTTPTANGPTGYMSDSYRSPRSQSPAAGSRTPSHSGSLHSEPPLGAHRSTSQSLPRSQGSASSTPRSSASTMPRTPGGSNRPTTTYNLSIKVGDVKGSGTDGNVYIQLFGEKSNTAKIQLRQAGDVRNKFEKGRTYKFTVDTADIGKVDRIKLSHDHTGYGSGFYVEEVEVEVPARQDRVKFPCRCWLAQDQDDGKIEREMTAQTQLPNTPYTMSVKLGEVLSPDTNLYVQLYGEQGETSKIMLRPVGSSLNKFEKGRTYKFTVETVDIGKIQRLRIGHDSKGAGKGIFIEEVEVVPDKGERAVFPCYCWLAEDQEDGRLERDMLPGQPRPPRPNVSYHLAIKTGDIPNAGTDANVYFQLVGEDGETEKVQLRQGGKAEKRFERGRTDKFIVETVDVGKIHKLIIGHDGKGFAAGWYLDEVSVDVPSRNEHVVFPCKRWLDSSEDDKKIERELYPGIPMPAAPKQSRTIIEKTTTVTETHMGYSPSPKKQAIEPKKTVIEETRTYSTLPPKKPVHEEDQRFTTLPPSNRAIHEETHYRSQQPPPYQGTPTKRGVTEEQVTIERTTTVQGAPPAMGAERRAGYEDQISLEDSRYQGAPPAMGAERRAGYEDQISLEDSRYQGVPPSYKLPQKLREDYYYEESRTTEKHGPSADLLDNREIVAYQLCLKMGDVCGDGTEGNIFIQLFGDKGMTEKIQLRQDGNSKIRFEKGRTYKFTVETVDIGKIERVQVSHDCMRKDTGWYLEEVVVDVPSREEHTVFPCKSWLAVDRGDGRIDRDLSATTCLYHLAIKTGNEQNASTDTSVWVQVYGEKGDTGHVQLRRSGTMEKLFERSQTDFFTLDTNDVGRVEKIRVGHDGQQSSDDWYLEEIVLNSSVRGEHLVFPCSAWIVADQGDGTIEKELYPKQPICSYSVAIKTGNVKNASTNSNVYFQIFGDRGDTGVIELKQVCDTKNKLQRGSNLRFKLETQDIGNLEKIRVGHDGQGLGSGWFLEEIMIIVQEEAWVFLCHRWLADYEDDGKTERELHAERKTYAHEPDLQDLIEYLQTDDITLIINAAYYLQHLCYNDDGVKGKVRELGGIPVLVRLLDHHIEEVHRAAASCLRNLSYSKERDENKIAIAECHGIEALMRLLRRTEKVEIKELVLGILWNVSSCDDLKLRVLEICLLILVTIIIIPCSGWDRKLVEEGRAPEVRWSAIFRNASGILRNISSAGIEARREMRDCEGLVDSFVWTVRASIGKNDIDSKSVENSVCILRNLSYRLEQEIDREKYKDAEPAKEHEKETKFSPRPGCMGKSAKKNKTVKGSHQPIDKKDPVFGLPLLWQPEIVRSYLSILADSSNPETLEGASGAIHNLAACSWRWAILIRSTVRKERGLPILVELLRMDCDPVVRAVATALRNLAIDNRNKDLVGKYAMRDLVVRLPRSTDTAYNMSEQTVGVLLCTIHQVVNRNLDNAKSLRDNGGIKKIVPIANNVPNAKGETYSAKIVKTANQALITVWNLKDLRGAIKKEGWDYTKEVTDQYGQAPVPRPYDEVSLPRNARNKVVNPDTSTRPVRSEDATIPDARWEESQNRPPQRYMAEDGYEADDDSRRKKTPARNQREDFEMEDMGGYRQIDRQDEPRDVSHAPPAYGASSGPPAEHQYASVDKSKKKYKQKVAVEGGPASDSWV